MDILIVEDDKSVILDLKSFLGSLGHRVVSVVSCGEEAIQYAGELHPDLIFINIQLKGEIGGVETAKMITRIYKIPIIFLTVFIKNCLNISLQLPDDAVVISKPLKREHLEYSILRAASGE